jgi:hypothetical protein
LPVAHERDPDANGERQIWLEPRILNKLRYLRGPGESYSDVILRLVEIEAMRAENASDRAAIRLVALHSDYDSLTGVG